MPIISTFFGIVVRMYFDDHAPPHVHVAYQGHEALVALADGGILRDRCQGVHRRWSGNDVWDHQAELEQNWAKAQALRPLERIRGADND